jgi:hypothetical protein
MFTEGQRHRTPRVRENRIAALRRAIAADVYFVDTDELAHALLWTGAVEANAASTALHVADSDYLN